MDRLDQGEILEKDLIEIIQKSSDKFGEKIQIAAANAITILVAYGHIFADMNLRGINVPGAILRNGVFDGVDLENSDLRNTNMQNIILKDVNLKGANLKGINFFKYPYEKIEGIQEFLDTLDENTKNGIEKIDSNEMITKVFGRIQIWDVKEKKLLEIISAGHS